MKQKSSLRVLFEGNHYRNLETDEINYENVKSIEKIMKESFTLLFNICFVIAIGSCLLLILNLKNQLYQLGFPQASVTYIPSILIAVSIKVFNFVYQKVIKIVIDF